MTRTATRKTRKAARFSSIVSALTVLGLLVFMVSPALAHHKADHTQGQGQSEDNSNQAGAVSDHDGDADSSESTTYTEDNDSNDYDNGTSEANNIADEGDNAHPSGKDRSVENGGSGTQGKSESNPDDSKGPMRYEGAIGDDKANGPGGTDRADQDGNNGCGNDDDFDDDNNGHCGRPAAPVTPTRSETPPTVLPSTEVKVCPLGTDRAGQPMATIEDCNDEVLGRVDNANPVERDDDVLGVQIRNANPTVAAAPAAVKGAVLPFTGAGDIYSVTAIALLLLAAGMVILKLKKA